MTRRLIVNADDFGQSAGVNAGVVRAHRYGIVTSASLMVRRPAAGEAAVYAARHPRLSVGLHVDLGEWAYRSGSWIPVHTVVSSDGAEEARREIFDQLTRFRSLMHRDPTHLDSHQHVHRSEPARSILLQLSSEIRVPLRHFDPDVTHCGDFYGQSGKGYAFPEGITPESLVRIVESLPEGITELGCHPGEGGTLDSMYDVERGREVEALCHPVVAAAIREREVELCSFHDVARAVDRSPVQGTK